MALCLMLSGALLVWAALHPFTTYPVSLVLLRLLSIGRVRKQRNDSEPLEVLSPRDIAICMCAYDEEKVIVAKLENLLTLKRAYEGLEILVYVDGATDRTAELARAYEG
jgi:cellulose synthase/poly-beta-1,6-N-acetylglucosamine synthase-like glycosyltransferase